MAGKVRIIGGEWRSRQLQFTETPGLRPSADRVRETLFNWLQFDIAGKHCLDLFAGSGALGFEAASRGAGSVYMIEKHAAACRQLHANREKLTAHQISIVQQDVFQFLAGDSTPFDLVFLDPPFGKQLAAQTCHWLEDKQWLTPHAMIYVEVENKPMELEPPSHWQCIKQKSTGEISMLLFHR